MTDRDLLRARERDLRCARELRVELDFERGAERFAALVAAGAAAPVAGAGLAAGAGSGLFKSATAKLVGALLALSATTGAVLVATSAAPIDAPPAAGSSGAEVAVTRTHAVPTAARTGQVTTPLASQVAASAHAEDGPPAAAPSAPAPLGARADVPPALPSAQPSAPAPNAFSEELRSLASAKALIASSPQAALEVADAARGGRLDEEREIVAIRALVALGRREEARARAARFVSAHPDSLFRAVAAGVAAPAPGSPPAP